MVQVFEIWTNEDASEFAAKLAGRSKFLIKTNLNTTYSRILFAAPLVEESLNGLAVMLDAVLREMDGSRSELIHWK